jgi:hypothetical protein
VGLQVCNGAPDVRHGAAAHQELVDEGRLLLRLVLDKLLLAALAELEEGLASHVLMDIEQEGGRRGGRENKAIETQNKNTKSRLSHAPSECTV